MDKTGKVLCIIDTCSLVYLKDVKMAGRPLHKWLWSEFDVQFSAVVLDELSSFKQKLGFRYNWNDHVWASSKIPNYERAIFSSYQRKIEEGKCKHCRQIIWKDNTAKTDLADTDDRGERHNCCVALDAILNGKYTQVIFLSDDLRALRNHVHYFFETFPLGNIWTLFDFITYLLTKYYGTITLNDVQDALRSIHSQDVPHLVDSKKKRQRLEAYDRKLERVAQILSQINHRRLA
jgi:hypothetical protein